ncbi:ABC transporter substrate-binding protein [Leptolyngbya sp. FACHB-261]|uniref:ABC transporter substrate-binding protein n=1 Tax=Leptolyngbya sp. FACHB-261 TaxID=2692806 RepID=UPI00168607DF|nr:ABC transporter substrate-binding protein [Leptolyngbya sp. FACHB-261]MBD2101870.1 ABC transporter substrate-binding protein [Leptolyngbya sp. FACHB-261]
MIVRRLFVALLLLSCLLLGSCTSQQSDVIRLTLWQGVNPPPNRDVLNELVKRFNATHPDIQVDSYYAGQADQQIPKILAAVVGGAPPDLLWFTPMLTGQLVELNAIRPLDDFLNTSSTAQELDPALRESMTFQDQAWSVPFGVNNVGVFYRPDLFAAAGITELPQTWQQFREVARRLSRDTNGDGRIDQHGIFLALGKQEFAVFTWLPFLWSAGGELLSNNLPNLETPEAAAALQLWVDLLQDGSAVLSQPERGYETDYFFAGKVAMQITGPWTLGQFKQVGVDFGVMPIPTGTKPATAIGGENLFLFKTDAKREAAAWKFAEYVISEDFQTYWATRTGYLPVNLKSRQSPEYRDFIAQQPALKVFLDQMQAGRVRPLAPTYPYLSRALGRALETSLLQKATPEQALTTAQDNLNLVLAGR